MARCSAIQVEAAVVDRERAMRRPGERYSESSLGSSQIAILGSELILLIG
jgi:hypothetical protein